MAERIQGVSRKAAACAWLSRAATLMFLVYYTALDAIGGIGLGRTILTTQAMVASGQLSQQQLDGVVLLLNAMWTDPWVGGVGSFISQTGSWAVFVAASAAAVGLFLTRRAPLAAAGAAGRLWMGTTDEPRQPARADRVLPADHRRRVAVVDASRRGRRDRPPQPMTCQLRRTSGAGMLSIITLMQAGFPEASERSIAPGSSLALCTSSPCPPSAAATRS